MNNILMVAGGFLVGLLVGWISRPARKFRDTPLPETYTENINPRHGEKVIICDAEWTIM